MRKGTLVVVCGVLLVALGASGAFALPSMPSSDFQPWTGCGCHAGMVQSWNRTMHAQALTDPLYQAKLEEAERADSKLGEFCNGCHGPIAVMSGEIRGTDTSKLSKSSADAVACDFCHRVEGAATPLSNTSQIVSSDPAKRGRWSDSVSPSHATAHSPFHETAEFCGACHNVDHPVNGLPLEATYTEWKNSPYAAEGIVCQDCHMTPGPGVNKPVRGKAAGMGPQREHVYSMIWVGGNSALGPKELAEERLRAAAELDLTAPETLGGGKTDAVSVRITNVGAGHYLPTGLTDYREMWLEVTAEDAGGREFLKKRRDFVTVLADAEGNGPVELWEAESIKSDVRIPPRGSVDSTFTLEMPEAGPITVKAALYYRSATEAAAKKAGVEVPTTLMASTSQVVYTSGAERIASDDDARKDALARISGGNGPILALFGGFGLLLAAMVVWLMRSRRA